MNTEINELQRVVCTQNKRLLELGLVILTEGNVSQRRGDLMAIKPSGVPYEQMLPSQMVLIDIHTGAVVSDGGRVQWKPSVDTQIHLARYRHFPGVEGGIAHTHSLYATIFAQNCQPIPCMGTTHADAFNGTVPVTRPLTEIEVTDMEKSIGVAIAECLREGIPAVLVRHHGPFTFGKNAREAVDNALILEKISFLARHTAVTLNNAMPHALQKAHYARKHGAGASYGQP